MALDKRAWRCQKGHGAQEKGHGAAPCYFALDLTLGRICKVQLSDENKILMDNSMLERYRKFQG